MNDLSMFPGNEAQLSAPVRNRYFYGKLLDAHNLELEQRYFLDMGRLVNRLTLGSGVLCGLHVTAQDDGTIAVSPGVAVDGYGREIVVTETARVDLSSLELEHVDATAAKKRGTVTKKAAQEAAAKVWAHQLGDRARARSTVLCLSYHECPVEPAPVLVADCDLREECVPGAVRERFKLVLMNPADAPLPDDPCVIAGRRVEPTAVDAQTIARRILGSLAQQESTASTQSTTAAGLREQLYRNYQPSCAPGSACVPIALLTGSSAGAAINVDECVVRTTVYSNAVLLDLILCLAERIEECCGRKVTPTAPKIVGVAPELGASVAWSDFAKKLALPRPGIAISFDTTMRAESLKNQKKDPSEWLRLLMVYKGKTKSGALSLTLEYDREDDEKTLDGKDGQTVYYTFGLDVKDPKGLKLKKKLEELVKQGAQVYFLIQARADDVTQITAAAEPTALLDADFAGTRLPPDLLDWLWSAWALTLTSKVCSALVPYLATLPSQMPSFPSGNGVEGGIFHSSFTIDLKTDL